MSLALGLNSGSSFDGIDAVLVAIENASDGYPGRPKFVDGISHQWPPAVADMVLRSFDNKISIFELCRLNYAAGAAYAQAALELMEKAHVEPEDLEVIGFDGQTIYQEPPDYEGMAKLKDPSDLVARWFNGPYGCGLQIGEPAVVAEACETVTVTHFRTMDHALGGTGAPLMQYLDFVAFRDIGPVLTLNIGGIANCHLAHRDRSRMMAFDTGPGNVMLDHTAKALFREPYDPDGSIAARGKVDDKLLAELLTHPFFDRHPPRSAWRLDFGGDFARRHIDANKHLAPEDLMATFTEFSASAISRSIQDHIANLADIPVLIASGGGVRNKTLMASLRAKLPGSLRIATSDEFGIPPQFKEAIKFATLAHATVNRLANNIPAACGAERFGILGKVIQPPRLAIVGLPT
jgi:anhydro-N-acetylmuramic acid kinase